MNNIGTEIPEGLCILLVDDHPLVRAGMRSLIESIGSENQVVEVGSGEESIELVRESKFDIVFMDIELGGLDGVSTAMRLLQLEPKLKIVLVTGYTNKPVPRALLRSGLSGYMSKVAGPDEIALALQAVSQGQTYFSREIAQQLAVASAHHSDQECPFDRLSERELQVILLLLNGYRPSDAGETLYLSPKTISTYKTRACKKLGVENMAEMITLAIRWGVIEAPEPSGA